MELINYTMGGILEKYASETPNQDFLVYSDRGLRFTYSEFNERVNNFARGLTALGVKKDDKVGIWGKNVPDWLTIMFAAAKIGAISVTINTNYKTTELEYLLKDSDIHTLCLVSGYRDSDYVQMVYDLVPELKTTERGHFKSKLLPELRNVIYIGQEKQRGMYSTAEVIMTGKYSDADLTAIGRTLNTHEVVNIQYTSGTTGFPKGVMLSHHNILNNGFFVGERMNYTAADKVLTPVPLFHCFGCVLSLCAVITHGATMVMVEDFDPLVVLASIHKERCTAVYGVPTMFIAELNHPMFDMFDLKSLRTGIMAGSLCPIETMKEVMDKMHCKDIIIVYGLTETSPGMTTSSVTDSPEIRATTVGTALPHVEVKIIDPNTGEECPRGTQGEICCRGYNLMKGYYKKPKESAEVLYEDGFLRSGDLGVMDEEGYLRVTGRIKDMLIRGGENVYPREVENFIYTMPEVEAVEVAGIPSPKYGEEVAAYIRLKKGASLTEEDVKAFCRGKISRYKIPKYIFFIDEYPMTASGKIQKYKLKDIGLKILKDQGVEII